MRLRGRGGIAIPKRTLVVDLDQSADSWNAFLRELERQSEEALREAPAEAPEKSSGDAFWENAGVRIDPLAYFTLLTGAD